MIPFISISLHTFTCHSNQNEGKRETEKERERKKKGRASMLCIIRDGVRAESDRTGLSFSPLSLSFKKNYAE